MTRLIAVQGDITSYPSEDAMLETVPLIAFSDRDFAVIRDALAVNP